MKITSIFILVFVAVLLFQRSSVVEATTSINTFQITTDSSQQSSPFIHIIHKNLVVYGSLGDIWGYDLETKENFSIYERQGNQFVTHFFKNLVIYEDTPEGESTPDVRMYDIKKSKDELVSGGVGAQAGGVTNGDIVVYVDGGACGSIHAYNIKKKVDSVISPTGCQPLRIADNTVVWANGAAGGSNIYGYDLQKGKSLDIITDPDFQESPNIFNDTVVWLHYTTGALGDYNAIKLKNLKTDEIKTLYESTTTTLQSPAVSDRYVIWSESSALHVGGVKGIDLKTGEVFEIQPQGSHQNSHTSISLWKNTAAWPAWRTGNGDIYGSTFDKN